MTFPNTPTNKKLLPVSDITTFKTPTSKKLLDSEVHIPSSPFMQTLGYGTGVKVYKLERTRTQSPWAIKKVSGREQKLNVMEHRLHVEASILRTLTHPNIVGFRGSTVDKDGRMCLAMEACTSCLGNLIEERFENELGSFEPDRILKVAHDVAEALDYLHREARILHCDIKSYNILVKGNFEICKLCDFGICLPLNEKGEVNKEHIQDKDVLGSVAWMAPETIKSDILSIKTDVYSYGIVIWEMLSLIPPLVQELEESGTIDLDTSTLDDLNSTTDSAFDDSEIETNVRKFGSRPELPPQEFSGDYNPILEIFYICTIENPDFRPKSEDLVEMTENIKKEMKEYK